MFPCFIETKNKNLKPNDEIFEIMTALQLYFHCVFYLQIKHACPHR